MNKNMNPVVHFEMPYTDSQRLKDFYSKAFGWQMQVFGEEMGNYVLAITAETDETTMQPKNPGSINGGFFPREGGNDSPRVVVAVDDVRAAMRSVESAGGTVVELETPGEPIEIPGIGLYSIIVDSAGNTVGVLQPAPMPE